MPNTNERDVIQLKLHTHMCHWILIRLDIDLVLPDKNPKLIPPAAYQIETHPDQCEKGLPPLPPTVIGGTT